MNEGGFFIIDEPQQRKPLALLPKCGACGLDQTCRSPYMPVYGRGRKRILLIGEGPAYHEDVAGIPFAPNGKAGGYLRSVLRKYGVDMQRDCWTTNATICAISSGNPTPKQVDCCRPNLIKTVRELQPDVIIPMGEPAMRSLISWVWKEHPGKIGRWVGWHIPCQQPNTWIAPNYHPSHATRGMDEGNPVAEVLFKRYLKRALRLEGKPWKETEIPNYKAQVRRIMDPVEAARQIRAMMFDSRWGKEHPLAFDYETNCLKPDSEGAEIVCCAISDGFVSLAYPWVGEAVKATREFLRSPIPKIGANCKFEHVWTMKILNCQVKNWVHDVVIAAHTLDNREKISGVKFQAFVLLGALSYDDRIKPYLVGEGGNGKNRIRELDMMELLLYCGLDSLLEHKIATKQMGQIR